MARKLGIAILGLTLAAGAEARLTSDYIRTPEGALVMAGDDRMEVIDKLGPPDRRGSETLYYRVDGRTYRIEFEGETVRWIRRSRE